MFFRGKRGQVTLIVVVGLLILFVFGFLIFVRSYIENNSLQRQASKQVQEYISQNSINLYVTSCLDVVADEAIILAGLQGARLNFSNTSYVEFYNSEYNRTTNVSVVIFPTTNYSIAEYDCPLVDYAPPYYPYPNKKVNPSDELIWLYDHDPLTCKYSSIFMHYSGFFGYNKLTKLCNFQGSNRIGATATSIGVKTCETGTYDNQDFKSTQEELETFIEQEINLCVNFTAIEEKSTSNITVINTPRAIVTFGLRQVNIRMQYPFQILINKKQPIIQMIDFSVQKPIPFKELYDYSFYAITTDVQEANFSMLTHKTANDKLAKTYHGYEINRYRDVDGNFTDIIQLIDNATIIFGRPLIMQFAIQNRRPALEYIHQSTSFPIDLYSVEGETMTIVPDAYDPEEDDLEYNYTLWKEDYDEKFNFADIKCANAMSIYYIIANCSIRNNSLRPHNWTKSDLFIHSGKYASYKTNKNDTGYHELKVSVKEKYRQGLDDWQIVRVLIFDKPVAKITGRNMYGGKYASFEDVYVLDGSNSTVGTSYNLLNNNFSTFQWINTEFNVLSEIKTEINKLLYLPLDVNGSFNINNISVLVFTNGSASGIHNITFIVNTTLGFFDMAYLAVNVTQCIPYRNTTSPYPYNTTDGFYADHTCCADDYTYRLDDHQCFGSVAYGANKSLKNYQVEPLKPPIYNIQYTYGPKYLASNLQNNKYDNDIFVQDFKRECSGTRGNICSGNATETRTVVEECRDDNYAGAEFQQERCSGPPSTSSSPTQPVCFPYPAGDSFEKLFLTGYDGICTTDKQCATGPGSGKFSTTGKYACNGQCGGNGKCDTAINCKCDSSHCGADAGCQGVDYSLNPSSPLSLSCSFGSDNYEDICDNCGLQNKLPLTCRYSTTSTAKCSAAQTCDGKQPNDKLNNNYQFCNSNCQVQSCSPYVYGNNGICKLPCSSNADCVSGYKCQIGQCIPN